MEKDIKLNQLDRIEYNIKLNRIILFSLNWGITSILCVMLTMISGFYFIMALYSLYKCFSVYRKGIKKLDNQFFEIEIKPRGKK